MHNSRKEDWNIIVEASARIWHLLINKPEPLPNPCGCLGALQLTSPREKPHFAPHSLLHSDTHSRLYLRAAVNPVRRRTHFDLESTFRISRPGFSIGWYPAVEPCLPMRLQLHSKPESLAFHSELSNYASGAQASWMVTLGLLVINSGKQRVGQ